MTDTEKKQWMQRKKSGVILRSCFSDKDVYTELLQIEFQCFTIKYHKRTGAFIIN